MSNGWSRGTKQQRSLKVNKVFKTLEEMGFSPTESDHYVADYTGASVHATAQWRRGARHPRGNYWELICKLAEESDFKPKKNQRKAVRKLEPKTNGLDDTSKVILAAAKSLSREDKAAIVMALTADLVSVAD